MTTLINVSSVPFAATIRVFLLRSRSNDIWLCPACLALSTLHMIGGPRTVGTRIKNFKGSIKVSTEGIDMSKIFGTSKDATIKISCHYRESVTINNFITESLNQVECNPIHFLRDSLMQDTKISFQFLKKIQCRANSKLPVYYYNTPSNGECSVSMILQIEKRATRPGLNVENEKGIKYRDTISGTGITTAAGRRSLTDNLKLWQNLIKPTNESKSLNATKSLLDQWIIYLNSAADITSVPKSLWMNSVDVKHCIGKRFIFGIFEEFPDLSHGGELWARMEVASLGPNYKGFPISQIQKIIAASNYAMLDSTQHFCMLPSIAKTLEFTRLKEAVEDYAAQLLQLMGIDQILEWRYSQLNQPKRQHYQMNGSNTNVENEPPNARRRFENGDSLTRLNDTPTDVSPPFCTKKRMPSEDNNDSKLDANSMSHPATGREAVGDSAGLSTDFQDYLCLGSDRKRLKYTESNNAPNETVGNSSGEDEVRNNDTQVDQDCTLTVPTNTAEPSAHDDDVQALEQIVIALLDNLTAALPSENAEESQLETEIGGIVGVPPILLDPVHENELLTTAEPGRTMDAPSKPPDEVAHENTAAALERTIVHRCPQQHILPDCLLSELSLDGIAVICQYNAAPKHIPPSVLELTGESHGVPK